MVYNWKGDSKWQLRCKSVTTKVGIKSQNTEQGKTQLDEPKHLKFGHGHSWKVILECSKYILGFTLEIFSLHDKKNCCNLCCGFMRSFFFFFLNPHRVLYRSSDILCTTLHGQTYINVITICNFHYPFFFSSPISALFSGFKNYLTYSILMASVPKSTGHFKHVTQFTTAVFIKYISPCF